MRETVIITSRYHAGKVCSVVRGTREQINAILQADPWLHGFNCTRPSDWFYDGEVIDLNQSPYTILFNAIKAIQSGVAQLPESKRWLIR